jgi:hypothetical protein
MMVASLIPQPLLPSWEKGNQSSPLPFWERVWGEGNPRVSRAINLVKLKPVV